MDFTSIKIGLTQGSKGPQTILFAIVINAVIQILNIGINHIKTSITNKNEKQGHLQRDMSNNIIQNLIDNIIKKYDGVRVSVIEFSNTNKNIALIPFNRMVCTYETYRIGYQSAFDIYNNIPTTLIGKTLQQMVEKKHVIVSTDNRDPDIVDMAYELLEKRKSKYALCIPIMKPLDNIMIGYIIFDSDDISLFTEELITDLSYISARVGTLLSFK